ncbi:hypothetical protein PYW08_005290 [Mythimna loreyi]|uniref:Uncharacterized protein n=1 Tax=Mythimna loreyi TaxID=667449 RepID=A0ACC2QH52_9NEOP|nr:hypothetical protein PYW08_005290 [Mythimna loreyi]
MCGRQLVLALITVYVGFVHSWDIAISIGDTLEFYTNGIKTDTVHFKSLNLTAITYDELHNMILFVDKQHDHDSICGYSLSSKDIRCFVKRFGSNIYDLAFDPATDLLYFTDINEQNINSISLEDHMSESNDYGRVLIAMDGDDRIPGNIAVDSCNGYIYWTVSKRDHRISSYYMERLEAFRSDLTQIIHRYVPIRSFAIDPQTQKNYFIAGFNLNFFNKADLTAKNFNRQKETILSNYHKSTQELTISKEYIYWVSSRGSYKTVWQIPKNATKLSAKPKEIFNFYTTKTVGIATNYKIKDQVQSLQNCEVLANLTTYMKENTELDETTETDKATETEPTTELYQTTYMTENTEQSETTETDQATEAEQTTEFYQTTYMTENTEENETTETDQATEAEQTTELYQTTYMTENTEENETTETDQATEAEQTTEFYQTTYMTENTEQDETTETQLKLVTEVAHAPAWWNASYCKKNNDCQDYCFQGSCDYNKEGRPVCRCYAGYSGDRCEVFACHNYCLNNGICSLNEEDEPVCQCDGDYEGSRCEAVKNHTKNFIFALHLLSTTEPLKLADLLSKTVAKISVTVEV